MHRRTVFLTALLLAFVLFSANIAAAQGPDTQDTTDAQAAVGTAFTYQGRLTDAGNPANGTYDFQFELHAKADGDAPVSGAIVRNDVAVTDGRFTVELNFGPGVFDGAARYLEIGVRPGSSDGSFTTLDPRQRLTPAPYARFAINGPFWRLGGNAGTTPANDFLGTSDNQPFELRVNAQRVVRMEPGSDSGQFVPKVLIGAPSNNAAGSATAATIGGGMDNTIADKFATIGGGRQNQTGSAFFNTVAGGNSNTAAGGAATVAGGAQNTAGGGEATVAGGDRNEANGDFATVGGGTVNAALADSTTIAGGDDNEASETGATVAGGVENTASGLHSTVGGGRLNTASGLQATVPGGLSNTATQGWTFAAGRNAHALHAGSFVWSDGTAIGPAQPSFESTGAGQFLVSASGGVGINTNTPVTQLDVQADACCTDSDVADHVAVVTNTTTSNNPDVLALRLSVTDPGVSSNYLTFLDAGGVVGEIEGNGSGGVTLDSASGDFAEYLPKRDTNATFEPGDVVGLFGGRISKRTAGADRVMAVTTAPIVLGNSPEAETDTSVTPIAFMGQVPVKVRGVVDAGDYIVPTGRNDGTGVAVSPENITPDQAGQVVGRALEAADGTGIATVNTLVGLPNDQAWQSVLAQREARIAELETRMTELERVVATEDDAGSLFAGLPLSNLLLGGLLLGGFVLWQRRTEGTLS